MFLSDHWPRAEAGRRDAGVALLENLDLTGVALPLRIVGGDSSPVRAILRR
jgi:kynurenine formamidase